MFDESIEPSGRCRAGRSCEDGAFAGDLGSAAGAATCRFRMRYFIVALTFVWVIWRCACSTSVSRSKFAPNVHEYWPISMTVPAEGVGLGVDVPLILVKVAVVETEGTVGRVAVLILLCEVGSSEDVEGVLSSCRCTRVKPLSKFSTASLRVVVWLVVLVDVELFE